ncbi:MAG: hypothetical protein AAF542_14800 [Pseudomonadota bacterium]
MRTTPNFSILLATLIAALLSFTAQAGEDGYICKIFEVRVLSNEGTLIESKKFTRQFEDRSFSINRNNGEMIGMPFTTSAYKSTTVLDRGGENSSYKSMAQSEAPLAAMFMYVAEHFQDREKPFWGTANGTQIYSGICE